MNKLKVGVLYETWGHDEAPPEPEKKKRRPGKQRKKREKHDYEEIFEALEKLGHEPSYVTLDGEDKTLTALARSEADIFFNLVESYAGDDTKETQVAGYLDLIRRLYTGAGPQGLYLAQDKGLAKKIFQFHGIRSPYFAMCYQGMLENSHDIKF